MNFQISDLKSDLQRVKNDMWRFVDREELSRELRDLDQKIDKKVDYWTVENRLEAIEIRLSNLEDTLNEIKFASND